MLLVLARTSMSTFMVVGFWRPSKDKPWLSISGGVQLHDRMLAFPVLRFPAFADSGAVLRIAAAPVAWNVVLQPADPIAFPVNIPAWRKNAVPVVEPQQRILEVRVMIGADPLPPGFTKLDRSMNHSANLNEVCLYRQIFFCVCFVFALVCPTFQGAFGGDPVFLAIRRGPEDEHNVAVADIGFIVADVDNIPDGYVIVDKSTGGQVANLSAGADPSTPWMLCYRQCSQGSDEPGLTDIEVIWPEASEKPPEVWLPPLCPPIFLHLTSSLGFHEDNSITRREPNGGGPKQGLVVYVL